MAESKPKNKGRRLSIQLLLIAVGILCVYLALNFAAARFAISSEQSDRISKGMTRDDVLGIAGTPHQKDQHGWQYRVWNGWLPYSDMLKVEFGENGSVNWVSF